jgi:fibronectin type 3 domain-containing protein
MNRSLSAPDTSPPSAPGNLTANGGLGQIQLSWTASQDDVAVTGYTLYRSTNSGFTPSASNQIAQPPGTSYTDSGLSAGTYYYKVTAHDAAQNQSPASNQATATATADTTPPTVSVTAPAAGATVSGTVTVTASASDNGSVAGVQFTLDGASLGAEDTTAPYSISWDTTGSSNGSHTLSAIARDAAGNKTTAANVAVTVQNTGSLGLVGAWAFDEGTGTTTADQSGKQNTGTVSNTVWVTDGKFNDALSFNGSSSWVSVADSSSLDLTSAMTLEAWVKPTTTSGWRTAVVKERSGGLVYGMYASTNTGVPEAEVDIGGTTRSIVGPSALPTGSWSHLAATYDGTTLRLYVNGAQVAQLAVSGSIQTSTSALRMGGNGVWGERLSGVIDEVRVYNRALSATQIQADMAKSITPDTTPPAVVSRSPLPGAAGVNVGSSVRVGFSEPMDAASLSGSSLLVRDGSGAAVAGAVSYEAGSSTASFTPAAALAYGQSYTVLVKGGQGGVADAAGNPLAADVSWSFTTEASPPLVLLVTSQANPFSGYLGEILQAEGLNEYTTLDAGFLSPSLLARFDVVLLGEQTLSSSQASMLSDWVQAGGNLIAMRPDPKLASLLGLSPSGSSLANGYLKIDTTSGPGAGLVASTIQYHGSADRYTLAGASALATLYSDAGSATNNPAVSLRSVGTNGGQAAAFSYDLARSVVLTRQGNPAWAGQERDGVVGVRPDDLYYGAKSGDPQPDWVDTSKLLIPQADEQQRLLANLITLMEQDRLPLPHFWYLPNGDKAVLVMSGDDHSPDQAAGGTASNFDRFKTLSLPGCSVGAWQCIRSTSYIFPDSTLTASQAGAYQADGFEVALHPVVASCPTSILSHDQLAGIIDNQLAQFRAAYPNLSPPQSSRTHCVYWPDWASLPEIEQAAGIRLDANYYHYPGPWIGDKPGFLTGSGFPMRFAEQNGAPIDVYQENTALNDEADQAYPDTVDTLLDNALGPQGFYGAFGVNIHNDDPAPQIDDEAIISSAQARNVPLTSYKQLLTWTDGRNNSTIRALAWNNNTLSFTTTIGNGANGLQTLLPSHGPNNTTLTTLTCNTTPTPNTTQTIKGIPYATIPTTNGTCTANNQ